jgi:hypothetical protein
LEQTAIGGKTMNEPYSVSTIQIIKFDHGKFSIVKAGSKAKDIDEYVLALMALKARMENKNG